MIVVRGIRFAALCEHHLLPFTGIACVGYIPRDGKVIGLSKIPRLVDYYSKRLQIQERMTQDIAKHLMNSLNPLGVGVVLRARHSCMGIRGAYQPESEMVTDCLLGIFRDKARQEFLDMTK